MSHSNIPYLRAHSYYSFLGALLSPKNLAIQAARENIITLGLTDHFHLTGAIEFYESCQQAGIKPILGLEIELCFEGFTGLLTLLAKNKTGWSNLCRLSTLLLTKNTPLDLSILAKHKQGLICIDGDPRCILLDLIRSNVTSLKLIDDYLDNLQSIFFQNFYIEIQRYPNGPLKYEQQIIEAAKRHSLPRIATQNIYYENPQKQKVFKTLSAIRQNVPINKLTKKQLPPGSAHFPSQMDFAYRYHDLPEALTNLHQLAEQCQLALSLGETHFPKFPTPAGITQAELLREKAYAGAKEHYQTITSEIAKRLDDELEIITSMGYEPIFLIVEDVLNHAQKIGVPTSSRGSAASSLVAHCLNITSPDPLALNLYFERFLNPARKKPPDIDTDIASHRRDEVIQYVFDTFGVDHTAMVGTINRFRPKSALGDVAKAYGLNPETIRQLSKKLPSSYGFSRGNASAAPFDALFGEHPIPIMMDIAKDAEVLLDLPRHLSVHPGGIVISPFPITDLVPLDYSASLGVSHTQFALEDIEKLGLVKIDLLGIRGLTVLGEVAEKIHSWRIKEYENPLDVLAKIPLDDDSTSNMIASAKTIGCFQIESPGMRATLQEINAKSVEDIIAALALYRPGPLRGGLRDAFVRRFRGEEPITHIHETLEDLLADTFGVILYQEQVLRIAHELGGLTIAQADILRRAMSHFDPGGIMETLRKHFILGAGERKGVPPETAERIWEMMAAFAGYGFPKAHAASYAQLAWNSAWCKCHYPAEFMAAVLGFGGGYYSQRVYLMETRRLGLEIHPPHINHANHRFRVTYPKGKPALYMGLNQVRELTQQTIQKIIQERPFTSLEDFLIRVDPQRKEAKHLIMCGALDGLVSIPQALERIEHQRPPGQLQLFERTTKTEDWTQADKMDAQQKILGISLEMSPLEKAAGTIQDAGAFTTLQAINHIGQKIIIAGMRQSFRRFRNHSNQMMGFLILEDLEGSIQVIIPPEIYRKNNQILREPGPFFIEGVVEIDEQRQQPKLIAHTMTLIK